MLSSKKTFKKFLTFLAWIVLACFSSESVFGDSVALNAVVPLAHSEERFFNPKIQIPSSYGTLKKVFKGQRPELVILLQDAHSNESVQKNIARILDHLIETQSLKLITLEGASGELYPKLFSFLPDKSAKRDVSNYFLKEGRLTGAEYLAISKRPNVSLYGIEDKALYERNRTAYLFFLKNREEILKQTEKLGELLKNVSHHALPQDAFRLYVRRHEFSENSLQFPAYLEILSQLSEKYSLESEKFPQLEKIFDHLHKKNNLEQNDLNTSESFLEEIPRLETSLEEKLLESSQEKNLGRLWRIFEIYKKILRMNLTKEDAAFFFENRKEFSINHFKETLAPLLEEFHFSSTFPKEIESLDNRLEKADRFYALALERDEALIDRALDVMNERKQPVIAMVTGGFHTPGIEKRLAEDGFSYAVITPKMTEPEIQTGENRNYEDALIQKPLPLEDFLVQAFLKTQPEKNNTQFQLTPELVSPVKSDLLAILRGDAHPQTLSFFTQILIATLFNGRNPSETTKQIQQLLPTDMDAQARAVLADRILGYSHRVYRESKSAKNTSPAVQTFYSLDSDRTADVLIRSRKLRDGQRAMARWNSGFLKKSKVKIGDFYYFALHHVPIDLVDNDVVQELNTSQRSEIRDSIMEEETVPVTEHPDEGILSAIENYTIRFLIAGTHSFSTVPNSLRSVYLFHQTALRQVQRHIEDLQDDEMPGFDFDHFVFWVYWDHLKFSLENISDDETKSWMAYRILMEGLPQLRGLRKQALARQEKLSQQASRSEIRRIQPFQRPLHFEKLESRSLPSGTGMIFTPLPENTSLNVPYADLTSDQNTFFQVDAVITKIDGLITSVNENYRRNKAAVQEITSYTYQGKEVASRDWTVSENGKPVFSEHWVFERQDGRITGFHGTRKINGTLYELRGIYSYDEENRPAALSVEITNHSTGETSQEKFEFVYDGDQILENSLGETRALQIPDFKNHPVNLPTQITQSHFVNGKVSGVTTIKIQYREASTSIPTLTSSSQPVSQNTSPRLITSRSGTVSTAGPFAGRTKEETIVTGGGSQKAVEEKNPEEETVPLPEETTPALATPQLSPALRNVELETAAELPASETVEVASAPFKFQETIPTTSKAAVVETTQETKVGFWTPASFWGSLTLSGLFTASLFTPSLVEFARNFLDSFQQWGMPVGTTLIVGLTVMALTPVKKSGEESWARTNSMRSETRNLSAKLFKIVLLFTSWLSLYELPSLRSQEPEIISTAGSSLEKNDIGFEIPSPMTGILDTSLLFQKIEAAKRNPDASAYLSQENSTLLFVKGGEVIAQVSDEKLQHDLERLNALIQNAYEDYGRSTGFPVVAHPYYNPAVENWLRQNSSSETLQKLMTWHTDHGKLTLPQVAEKWRKNQSAFITKHSETQYGFRLFSLLVERLELQRRNFETIRAPEDGFITIESIRNRGVITKGNPILKMIPAKRFSTQVHAAQRLLPSTGFEVTDHRGQKGPAQILGIRGLTLVPEHTGQIFFDADLQVRDVKAGIPQKVHLAESAPQKELLPIYQLEFPAQGVAYGRTGVRSRTSVSAPQIDGYWTPDGKFPDASVITANDSVGSVEIPEAIQSSLPVLDFLDRLSVQWQEVIKIQNRQDPKQMIKEGVSSPSYIALEKWQAQTRKFRKDLNLNTSRVSSPGIYFPNYWKSSQFVGRGEEIGTIYHDHIFMGGVRIPTESIAVHPHDIVLIQSSSGRKFLGEIRNIQKVRNAGNQDLSRYSELSEIMIPDLHSFQTDDKTPQLLGNQEPVAVILPSPQEQPALHQKFQTLMNQGLRSGTQIYPLSMKPTDLPPAIEYWLLEKIRQPGLARNHKNILESILQEVSSHERIRSAKYFIHHFQSEPDFRTLLNKLILEGQPEISQMGLDLLKDEERVVELVELFETFQQKNPQSFQTHYVYQIIRELLETHPNALSLLIQASSQNSFHQTLDRFFRTVLVSEPDRNGLFSQMILRSSFWTDDDLVSVENTGQELERRIGYEQTLHFREGFAPKGAKDKIYNVLSIEARDNIRRLEMDNLDSLLLFTASPHWTEWPNLVSEELSQAISKGQKYAEVSSKPAVPKISRTVSFSLNPLFLSKDFDGQKKAIQILFEKKKVYDLIHLLESPETRKIHGTQILFLLNKTPEGRLLLAELYWGLQGDKDFLFLIEKSDFPSRVMDDLVILKNDVESLLLNEKSGVDLKASLKTISQNNTSAKTYLLQSSLAKLISRIPRNTPENQEKHQTFLKALMRSLVSRYELSEFILKSGPFFDVLNKMGIPEEEIHAAAQEEAERRSWLYSIALAKEKYGFVVFDVVYPGVPHKESVLLEQNLDPRRYHREPLQQVLQKALAEGTLSRELYDALTLNQKIFIDQITKNVHEKLQKSHIAWWTSAAVLAAVGLLGIVFTGSLFAIFLGPFLARWQNQRQSSAERLDQIAEETQPDEPAAEAAEMVRAEIRQESELTWTRFLSSYLSFFAHRSQLKSPDHLKYDGSDLRETFYTWSKLLKEPSLSAQDYAQLLKLPRKVLFDKKLLYSTEKLTNIKSWNTEAEADLLQIWLDLLEITLDRIANDAEKIKEKIRTSNPDAEAQLKQNLYEMGLWMQEELIPLKKSALSLRALVGAADYLKFNFAYQKTFIHYGSHPINWPFWIVNRIAYVWFGTVRLFTSLAMMGLLSKKWFLDTLNRHLENAGEIAPGLYPEKTLQDSTGIIHRALFYQDSPQGRLGGLELDEWRKMFSRTLTVGSTFAIIFLFFFQFFLSKSYVIDYFGAVANLGSFFAVLGLGLHNLQSILRWWTSAAPQQFTVSLKKNAKIAKQLLKFGPEEIQKSEFFNQTPSLALAHKKTIQAFKNETGPHSKPSVDAVVVVISPGEAGKKEALRKQLAPYIRTDIPLIIHFQDIPGSGGAYLSAHQAVKKQYDIMAETSKYSQMARTFDQARIVYLLAGGEKGDPLSLFQGSDKRVLPETLEGRPLDTLIYALLNGYKAAQNMRREKKSGEILMATDGLYQGDLLPQGNITLIGSFVNAKEIVREGLGVMFDTFGRKLRDFLDHPTLDAVQKYVARTRKRTRLYQHHDNLDLKQYASFTGNVLLAFDANDVTREQWESRIDDLLKVSRQAVKKSNAFVLDLSKDILIPQTVHGEIRWGTFLAYRTLNMPDLLRDLYDDVLDVHHHYAKDTSSVPLVISPFVAAPSQSSFRDLRDASTYYDTITARNAKPFQDPEGLIRVDSSQRSLLIGFNGTPVKPGKNTLMAHLNFDGNGKHEEVVYLQGLSENPFRDPSKFLGVDSEVLIRRLRDQHGEPLFNGHKVDFAEVPLFPKGPFDSKKLDWLAQIPGDKAIAFPVENRQDLETNWVSLNWILKHTKELNLNHAHAETNRSELRAAAVIAGLGSIQEMLSPAYGESLLRTLPELRGFERNLPGIFDAAAALRNVTRNSGLPAKGSFVFQYDPERHSLGLLKSLQEQMPKGAKLIVVMAPEVTSEERSELRQELSGFFAQAIQRQEVEIPDFSVPGWSFENFLQYHLKRQGLKTENIFNLDESRLPASLLKNAYLHPIYLHAASYASQYVVLAGGFKTTPSSQVLGMDELLLASRAFQEAA